MISMMDYGVLLIYFALILGIGYRFSRRNRDPEAYFLGGRNFPDWVIGLSLVGTSISSITFLAYPADSFKTGWIRYLPNLVLPLAALISVRFFLPYFRKQGVTTAYECLQAHFGRSVRVYAAVVFLVGQLVRISIILYLLSLLVEALTGFDPIYCLLICGGFVALYTYWGGIEAVVWTDVIQTVVLAFGGLFCLWIIIDALPGGISELLQTAQAAGKFNLGEVRDGVVQSPSWGFLLSEKTLSMMLVLGLIHWLTEYCANQNTVQRFCAAKSDAAAKRGLWICVFTSLPIWGFYMLLGTALWVFFNERLDQLPQSILSGESKAEMILPYFITHYLPSGLVGLVLAAALSAAMSSLDSSINAMATVVTVDLYRDAESATQGSQRKEKQRQMRVAHGVTFVVSVLMMIGALVLHNTQMNTLQDTMTALVSILSGGLLGLYCLMFFTPVRSVAAVWSGIITTLLFSAWVVYLAKGQSASAVWGIDLYYTAILANLVMLISACAIQFVERVLKTGSITFFVTNKGVD